MNHSQVPHCTVQNIVMHIHVRNCLLLKSNFDAFMMPHPGNYGIYNASGIASDHTCRLKFDILLYIYVHVHVYILKNILLAQTCTCN